MKLSCILCILKEKGSREEGQAQKRRKLKAKAKRCVPGAIRLDAGQPLLKQLQRLT